jgi:tRNA-Thr(GGU) m(6)t(6)A37 methyltransferase TsaA
MDPICYTPIGVIHSPFTDVAGMPLQSAAARGVPGRIELLSDYADGTQDLDGFSHLWLLYHLHRITGFSLTLTPFLDDQPHGVFATRSPKRPNPIGLSVVRLVHAERSTLHIEDVDVLDGTPLLDIKPYLPDFDVREAERIGWFAGKIHRVSTVRSDDRFR